MTMPNNNIAFGEWLDIQAQELGLEAIACLRLDSPLLEGIAERYAPERLRNMPAYVQRDQQLKANPASYAPWAKSALVALGSFRKLPPAPTFKMFALAETDSPTAGLIAGYDLKLDYHIFGGRAMRNLSEALARREGHGIRAESLCDSNPLPERALAIASGLGYQGLHRCLLAKSSRDAVFVCSLLTELPLPERIFPEDEASLCNRCGACLSACPNGALSQDEGSPFDYSRCIVALSSETRGPLTMEQAKALGFWLAGCGECVRECPRSKLPPPVALDLDWLLNCPGSALDNAISTTSLSYEGTTLLRRNALAVLANREAPESLKLLARFREKTGSSMLRDFAGKLLKRQ